LAACAAIGSVVCGRQRAIAPPGLGRIATRSGSEAAPARSFALSTVLRSQPAPLCRGSACASGSSTCCSTFPLSYC